MPKGKKITELFNRRINIRMSTADWSKIILQAQKDKLPPSTWIRQKILKLLNKR